MTRPRINGNDRSSRTYSRISVPYLHKKERSRPNPSTESCFTSFRAKKTTDQQIDKARAANSCSVLDWTWNPRQLDDATVLPKVIEEEIVGWINDLRRDGTPVSRTML
ncbi:hypothetical protein PHMEG_00021852 [Phytophthora megakarya]|uniref:Uncharacterized protein n=1 Tax=Phytophthora megakarya TaxID=4795 RepID=A0A225VKU4_9STRA|nr:hypothetical protein PHMEG_00021852 [Phytophthora megakarya]